jgi:activating signal cointegrator complex subunit 3
VDEEDNVEPLTLGHIASYYYLKYTTVRMLNDRLDEDNDLPTLLEILSNSSEYDEVPVRHNEDKVQNDVHCTLTTARNPVCVAFS